MSVKVLNLLPDAARVLLLDRSIRISYQRTALPRHAPSSVRRRQGRQLVEMPSEWVEEQKQTKQEIPGALAGCWLATD